MVLILGIDGGYSHLGAALVDPDARDVVESATLGAPRGLTCEDLAVYFGDLLMPWMQRADLLGCESITYFTKARDRKRSGNETWVKIGAVMGAAHLLASQLGLKRKWLRPQGIKSAATGSQKASKDEMILSAHRNFPSFKGSHHEADAALAAMACWFPERLEQCRLSQVS